ncbi:MAG: hypothetical protein WA051_00530 [Minisyncoccia bacterium]
MTTHSNAILAQVAEVADSNYALLVSLSAMLEEQGEHAVLRFIRKVPESGDALWARFEAFRGTRKHIHFRDFFATICVPE